MGHRDGVAAQTQFFCPAGLVQLSDRRVLVAEASNIRRLSTDLQEASTLAGYDATPRNLLATLRGGAPA